MRARSKPPAREKSSLSRRLPGDFSLPWPGPSALQERKGGPATSSCLASVKRMGNIPPVAGFARRYVSGWQYRFPPFPQKARKGWGTLWFVGRSERSRAADRSVRPTSARFCNSVSVAKALGASPRYGRNRDGTTERPPVWKFGRSFGAEIAA